ncbi:GNAT family N-acetyltransferase [soil metagenome]
MSVVLRLAASDVEAIERATFDAVPPDAVGELPGWLLGFDRGTVSRAHSAVPVSHEAPGGAPDAEVIREIEALYASHGLRAVFRIPGLPAFDGFSAALRARGYEPRKPTRVMVASLADMRAAATGKDAEVMASPDDGWRDVFLGEGFDPVDGASRVQLLGRAQHGAYACVRVDGRTVAAGMGSFSRGWASVHGMRTLPAYRGRGMAGRILGAIAAQAMEREVERAFLQVDAPNLTTQELYSRFGFAAGWDYVYWSHP